MVRYTVSRTVYRIKGQGVVRKLGVGGVTGSNISDDRVYDTTPNGFRSFHNPRVKSGTVIGMLPFSTDHALSSMKQLHPAASPRCLE
jgi:hypothetical protein